MRVSSRKHSVICFQKVKGWIFYCLMSWDIIRLICTWIRDCNSKFRFLFIVFCLEYTFDVTSIVVKCLVTFFPHPVLIDHWQAGRKT